ncbi:hypothetical protein B0H16DRAFT_1454725 [Mycena metata]|uniref:Uncharacterized protein n=1 Tax=Mycena metata TaxID=1033252 RepID=A0AAD7JKU9_9AGAR|nr:hypothetical protein B0H16DRAFT_1454725 [Mycena metata]
MSSILHSVNDPCLLLDWYTCSNGADSNISGTKTSPPYALKVVGLAPSPPASLRSFASGWWFWEILIRAKRIGPMTWKHKKPWQQWKTCPTPTLSKVFPLPASKLAQSGFGYILDEITLLGVDLRFMGDEILHTKKLI